MENYGAGEVAPCVGITRADWHLRRQQSKRTTLSGDTDIIELGTPYWEVEIEVALAKRSTHFDVWSSFIDRRRGGDQTFLMSRTFRPGAREHGLNTPFPDAEISGFTVPTHLLTVTGALGWKPNSGDMISYNTPGGGLWIGQVVKDEVGATDPLTVQVEPKAVQPASPSNLRVIDALGEFVIDGEPRFREGHKRRSLTFKAKQVIR